VATISYRPRVVDEELSEQLTAMEAVVFEVTKAVGKTETARQQAASFVSSILTSRRVGRGGDSGSDSCRRGATADRRAAFEIKLGHSRSTWQLVACRGSRVASPALAAVILRVLP
jgi:hypothetical protein